MPLLRTAFLRKDSRGVCQPSWKIPGQVINFRREKAKKFANFDRLDQKSHDFKMKRIFEKFELFWNLVVRTSLERRHSKLAFISSS